ncbi:MAG: tetratricopeptide repeat protein, partial [Actinomycetes bacterium]
MTPALREVRLLDGPNLYFPRAAAKVTLDGSGLTETDAERLRDVAERLGLGRVRAGAPGSDQRRLAVLRVLRLVVRAVARAAGTGRLAVRVRPGSGPDEVVVAYPWRWSGRATALAEGLGDLLDRLADGTDDLDLPAAVRAAGERVVAADPGRAPAALRPRVPVVSVTGTNGKTTTTRLLAHLAMTAGRRTAWSSTDGVVVMGELVEPGDYSGPSGARRVLATPGLEIGVLETARGGLLLRGMGVVCNDVSVVTNVSADHLGLMGIDTLDQLAEVKAVVTHVTKPEGWVVLNGDDPRVLAMREASPARPFVFSLDPTSPSLRDALNHGGRGLTVLDGHITVLSRGTDPDKLVPVVDVPVTLAGLSSHNVANALAATAAALGIGLPREAVVEGLRSFRSDPAMNFGRMNLYSLPVDGGTATVVMDLAHNEAGLEALLVVSRGVLAPGGRLLLGLGAVGDRTDDLLKAMGALAARGADHVAIVHKERYLRGRTAAELEAPLRHGAAEVGVHDVPSYPSELAGLQGLVAQAAPGDVVAVMAHADREELDAWLRENGARPDGPGDVRAKVVAARGLHPREDELDSARALGVPQRLAAVTTLHEASPSDPRLAFERAEALDAAGRPADAVRRYRQALDAGLPEPRRTRARVQLAVALRSQGRPEEALAELDAVLAEHPSAAAAAFRALVLHDLGRPAEALRQALVELSTHLAGGDGEAYA